MDSQDKNIYPNLKINGRIFGVWVLKNFKHFQLPEIIRKDDEDPCKMTITKQELRKYQLFASQYMSYNSPYHDILLYHGLGSGKTATAINIYNVLYNSTSGWNVFLLVKAALVDDPWKKDLRKWLEKQDYEHRYSNIIWVHYDSPYADKEFEDAVRKTDSSKKNLYYIEECHNFFRNVYSNLTSKKGKRAINIYKSILEDKKRNQSTRVVLMSGTPAINSPFELAILFNLLRPGIFPDTESLFNQYYVDNNSTEGINKEMKNTFKRRILGLVSYYIGATPDLYARQVIHYVDCEMSMYQTDVYNYYENIEKEMEKRQKFSSGGGETYKTYTRQASNFVFPPIDGVVSGENRPRPNKFKIGDNEMNLLLGTKKIDKMKKTLSSQSQKYFDALKQFMDKLDNYFQKIYNEEQNKSENIEKDMENFKKYDTYDDYLKSSTKKSKLLLEMIKCSDKFANIIFNIIKSTGPVLMYSNFVLVEGLDVFKIYLKYFGFDSFKNKNSKDYFRYGEFHNNIPKEVRRETIKIENLEENKHGKLIKILMFSPAGSEGINLESIRQVHITEPYWNEVRIVQMIGRAVRQCSHKYLPLSERVVDIYRYRSVKNKTKIVEIIDGQMSKKEKVTIEDPNQLRTVDHSIENTARVKNNLIQTFLTCIKESAIDCELFKNHNMMKENYKCFKFNETSLFDKHIGPAYKNDILEDMKISNGSDSSRSVTIKVKVIKIRGYDNQDYQNTNIEQEIVTDPPITDIPQSRSNNIYLNREESPEEIKMSRTKAMETTNEIGEKVEKDYVENKTKEQFIEAKKKEEELNPSDNIEQKQNQAIDLNKIDYYWYNPDTGVVYDYDLHYPLGKVKYDDNGIPMKLDKDLYEIEFINIPVIEHA
jgi:superfamily II DNA or RNA helicase